MLEEKEFLDKILGAKSQDADGLMELMKISNKLDKNVQELNGDIFDMIENKSENFGLLQNLLREKEEIIKKKRESSNHDTIGNNVLTEKLRILQEILNDFRPQIVLKDKGFLISVQIQSFGYKLWVDGKFEIQEIFG